jgi:hypothetical protein
MKRGLRRDGWRPSRRWFLWGDPRLPVKDRDARYGTGMAADTVADLGQPDDLDAAAAIACLMALRNTFMHGPGAIG